MTYSMNANAITGIHTVLTLSGVNGVQIANLDYSKANSPNLASFLSSNNTWSVTNVPTAIFGINTDQIASTAFVKGTYTDFLASDNTFTEDSNLPTLETYDNSTRGTTRLIVFSYINQYAPLEQVLLQ